MSYYLGVDIGTFESKGVLVDRAGTVIASAARPHQMLVPRPGWAEHRPEQDWWQDFVAITQEIIASSHVDVKAIRSVGCSAIGPCMLPVDADGEPLMNAVLYGVDTRASAEVTELTAQIGESRLLEHSGNALTSQSVGPKILWLKHHHPELFAKTAKIQSASTFLVQKLTGACVIDHYTAAGFTPLYSLEQQDWSQALSADIIESERLPELHWSTDIVGEVSKQAALQCGLAPGTPVITGTIDAAAEAISTGALADGDMMMMYGSTIFIIMITKSQVTDPRLWYAPWLFEGEHTIMAGLATSGTLTQWFRHEFAQELSPDRAFSQLAAEASTSPPGANGLITLPYFSGERTPIHDPHAKGMIFGLDMTHTRGDVYRSLIEGIAFATAHVMDTYRDINRAPSTIYAVGGGTKNAVWTQATSDAIAQSQSVRKLTMGASYGDAFLGAMAVGDVQLADINHWNPTDHLIEVNEGNRKHYQRQYPLFRQLYEQNKGTMAAIAQVNRAS